MLQRWYIYFAKQMKMSWVYTRLNYVCQGGKQCFRANPPLISKLSSAVCYAHNDMYGDGFDFNVFCAVLPKGQVSLQQESVC